MGSILSMSCCDRSADSDTPLSPQTSSFPVLPAVQSTFAPTPPLNRAQTMTPSPAPHTAQSADRKSDPKLRDEAHVSLHGTRDSTEYAQADVALYGELETKERPTSTAGPAETTASPRDDGTRSDTGFTESTPRWQSDQNKQAGLQESTPVSHKFHWRFVDARAFVYSGALRIVRFEDIGDIDFVAISYVWTDDTRKWRDHICRTSGRTYEEKITRGSGMRSTFALSTNDLDSDAIARAKHFFTTIAFFVLARGKKFLWIDVLCIDQGEEREKKFYIPRMGDLYRRAAETHAYPFGARFPSSVSSDELYFPIWETRAWTVQEQILSKSVLFCYAFQGDVRKELGKHRGRKADGSEDDVEKEPKERSRGQGDPEELVHLHAPVLDKYQHANGIHFLQMKEGTVTCLMEQETPMWGNLSTSAWFSKVLPTFNAEPLEMRRGFSRDTSYKAISSFKKHRASNIAEAARISVVTLGTGRRSTVPEDMIYSILGTLDLWNFHVKYEIGFEEARLRVFEALSPKILGHIIGAEWTNGSTADNKDSALPRIVGSSPITGIVSLESAIRDCKYTRDIGTQINCRRETCRVWAPETHVRLNQGFVGTFLGNHQLLLMRIASIFDMPEAASMPTESIPLDLTKVIIAEMSTFGISSNDDASKIDRVVELVEVGKCNTGAFTVPSLPDLHGKSSVLALCCENVESGALVNKGTVLIMDASALSTEYVDTSIE